MNQIAAVAFGSAAVGAAAPIIAGHMGGGPAGQIPQAGMMTGVGAIGLGMLGIVAGFQSRPMIALAGAGLIAGATAAGVASITGRVAGDLDGQGTSPLGAALVPAGAAIGAGVAAAALMGLRPDMRAAQRATLALLGVLPAAFVGSVAGITLSGVNNAQAPTAP